MKYFSYANSYTRYNTDIIKPIVRAKNAEKTASYPREMFLYHGQVTTPFGFSFKDTVFARIPVSL